MKQNHETYTPDIILVETENAGNIGSVSRIMANMSFNNLILINPIDYKNNECKKMALSHYDIVLNAKTKDNLNEIINDYDYTIAFSRRKGRNRRNNGYFNYLLENLNEKDFFKNNYKIGFVFGRESTGLKKDEISLCSLVSELYTGKEDGSLNLSHCVGIVCYEYYKFINYNKTIHSKYNTKNNSVYEINTEIWHSIDKLLNDINFYGIDTRENVKKRIQNILKKSIIDNIDKDFIIKIVEKIRRIYLG